MGVGKKVNLSVRGGGAEDKKDRKPRIRLSQKLQSPQTEELIFTESAAGASAPAGDAVTFGTCASPDSPEM